MTIDYENRIHIDLEDGESLAEFATRSLVDRMFIDGGDTRRLVPAAMTESVSDILGLDHGSVLQAAIEEALSSSDSGERAAFFEGLGWWIHSADYLSLAAMFADSDLALRQMEDGNRKRDVAATWSEQRAVTARREATL